MQRLGESVSAAQQAGIRPRLVLFDYTDRPVAGQLRTAASELGMLVTVEPIERSLPTGLLRDRFRLLEKSRGVHGIFFPASLSPAHQACLDAHPTLAALTLDQPKEGFSPQVVSFLQLAALQSWDPRGRQAAVVVSEGTLLLGQRLVAELESLEMKVSCLLHPAELSGALSRSSLVWLCHGKPLSVATLHLGPDTVVVDGGRSFDLPASLDQAQTRLLSHRLRGLCPAEGGISSLVNLNRLHRLLQRAIGPRRSRASTVAVGRGRARA